MQISSHPPDIRGRSGEVSLTGDEEGSKERIFTRRDTVLMSIYTPLFMAQIVLFVFFFHNHLGLDLVLYLGWGIWVAGVALAIAPMVILKRRGGVPRGKSYMSTTELVETGLYGVVRHPQYLGGILFSVAMVLITHHWTCLAAGAGAMVPFYLSVVEEDRAMVEKFGDDYRRYMERVPRLNAFAGLARLVDRRKSEQ